MAGVREYWLSYRHFCGLKRAAIYGKTCLRLTETERIMCECVEIDLEKADDYFHYFHRGPSAEEGGVPVIFPFWELKITALEHAARELRTDQVSAAFDIRIAPAESDFPEFSEAVEVKHPSGSRYYTWRPE